MDSLDDLQLVAGKLPVSDSVGRDLKAVLTESDQPAHDDCLPEQGSSVLQMTVPGKRHKRIGNKKQDNRRHFVAMIPGQVIRTVF